MSFCGCIKMLKNPLKITKRMCNIFIEQKHDLLQLAIILWDVSGCFVLILNMHFFLSLDFNRVIYGMKNVVLNFEWGQFHWIRPAANRRFDAGKNLVSIAFYVMYVFDADNLSFIFILGMRRHLSFKSKHFISFIFYNWLLFSHNFHLVPFAFQWE